MTVTLRCVHIFGCSRSVITMPEHSMAMHGDAVAGVVQFIRSDESTDDCWYDKDIEKRPCDVYAGF